MNNNHRLLKLSDRGKGILMSIGGVFVLSPDSLLIRLAGLDDYTLLFYRGLFPIFSISLVLGIYYRGKLVEVLLGMGAAGILNGILFAGINISFISAIQRTSVANTLLFLSSAPIFAAILSLIVLRESQRLSTWLVIALSLFGIVIIGWGSYGSAGLVGDVFALACAIITACSAVLIRYKKDIDLVPSIVIGSFFTACYALAQSPELVVSSTQLVYVGIIGLILIPVAFIVLTIAPRLANSAEVQLVYLLESILGPLWVWLVINETPSLNTLIGGSILLLSVAWFAQHTLKQESVVTEPLG
ncbi:MAG: DMT family transporter [Gammaproteobacteria bacterium]|nr:MAG: DMT family transporter [Gammaproteobacteria bacterium]UCH41436.1 MAG: DMT family transporter [Gammaproteobacteria bacterium]